VASSQGARAYISRRAVTSIVGPGLSAVRASCDLWAEDTAAVAPVFERIGQQLDAAICQPGLDHFFTAEARQIVVAITDARWRSAVLFTTYSEHDVRPVSLRADAALRASIADCKDAGHAAVRPTDFIGPVWADWSRRVRKNIRTGATLWSNAPDLPVGTLFLCFAALRAQLDEIAAGGGTPVLAIALNSAGSTRRRLKCTLRAIAFPLPTWACASGAVAGNA
jgi:hypothetical protein